MLQPLSSLSRFMIVGLSSSEKSLIEMSVLARWTVQPRLMGVPGVANVSIFGQRERQLQVLVDPVTAEPEWRHARHPRRDDRQRPVVLSADVPRGIDPRDRRLHRHAATAPRHPAHHPDPVRRGPQQCRDRSRARGDRPLRIGDVATVVEDHQPLIGDGLVAGGNGLLLVLEKFPDVNTLEVTRNVESALKAMQPGSSWHRRRYARSSARRRSSMRRSATCRWRC